MPLAISRAAGPSKTTGTISGWGCLRGRDPTVVDAAEEGEGEVAAGGRALLVLLPKKRVPLGRAIGAGGGGEPPPEPAMTEDWRGRTGTLLAIVPAEEDGWWCGEGMGRLRLLNRCPVPLKGAKEPEAAEEETAEVESWALMSREPA